MDANEVIEIIKNMGPQVRLNLWKGGREDRVYIKTYNGSRGRPWIDKGYIAVRNDGIDLSRADWRGWESGYEAVARKFPGSLGIAAWAA